MLLRKALRRTVCGLAGMTALFAFQRPFRELPGIEYRLGAIPLPPIIKKRPSGPSPA